ncbi:MAG: TonB-dependent receptor [Hyphomonadaceae bacterium]|nr:TonB-dependent receptor [Hyphomonadaceae bacterium]
MRLFGRAAAKAALAASGFLSAMAALTPARAQDSDQAGVVDDVIVTASRRPELISRTPAAITAVSQDAFDSIGASALIDAVTTAPNLHASVANDVSIRGVGSNLYEAAAGGTPVAIHIDGVYTNDRGVLTRSAYDLERLEILRGPQGTLYGRNATGGVLNFITNAPGDAFGASGDFTLNSVDEITVRGAVDLPLTENLAFRLAGFAQTGEGYQENPDPDQANGDAADYVSGRLSMRWSPLPALTWNLSLQATRDRSISGTAQYAYFLNNAGEPVATNLPADQTAPLAPNSGGLALGDNVPADFAVRNQANLDIFSVRSRLAYALSDDLSLTYIAGYNHITDEGTTNSIPFILRRSDATAQENSHELNVNYEGERFRAVAGLYHFAEITGGANLISVWIPSAADRPELTPAIDQSNQLGRGVNNTDAIFGQGTLDLTDAMRLTLGARYTRDKIEIGAATQSHCPFGLIASPWQTAEEVFIGANPCAALNIPNFAFVEQLPGATAKFGRPSYLGTLEYDLTPSVLAYATVATGYRTGGVSDLTPEIVYYEPETNINYEAGVRARLLSNALMLNLTVFRETYRNMQIQLLDLPDTHTINAAEATIDGLEAEYFLAFSRADRITGYVTWLDARFDSFPEAFSGFRNTVIDASGNRLSQAPEWSARVSYSHIFELGALGDVTTTLQTYWQDESFAWYTNNVEDQVESYTRSDAIIRYQTADERVSIEAFVNNIEDHQTVNSVFPALGAGRMQWAFYARGRAAGVRLGVDF